MFLSTICLMCNPTLHAIQVRLSFWSFGVTWSDKNWSSHYKDEDGGRKNVEHWIIILEVGAHSLPPFASTFAYMRMPCDAYAYVCAHHSIERGIGKKSGARIIMFFIFVCSVHFFENSFSYSIASFSSFLKVPLSVNLFYCLCYLFQFVTLFPFSFY